MKDCNPTKTSPAGLLPVLAIVLTLFLGFGTSAGAQQPYKIRKVVLDAGHGGKDPGCHGHHTHEKEIALTITLELGRMIKSAFPDVEVIYTRETDKFIALHERAAIANRNKADLFISIHCNYIAGRNKATGTETYVLGLHRAEDNLDVAKRENASILLEEDFEKTYDGFDPYSAEGHIILSMFQNAHLEQSIMLANSVESAFKKLSHIPSRGVKQAGFLVLRETTMPSILIETGFLSTDADESFLMKKENQVKVADAIFKAFNQYKKDMEGSDYEFAVSTEKKEVAKATPDLKGPSAPKEESIRAEDKEAAKKDVAKAETKAETKMTTGGPVYRIQIAASSRPAIDARYQDLKDLEVIREHELYKFLVGNFKTYDDAKPRLAELRAQGFSGCFIVVYKDGQRIKA